MDRRSFLQVAGAGLTMLALPSLAVDTAPGVPKTVDELIAWFDANFDTEVGMPTATHRQGMPKDMWDWYYKNKEKYPWLDAPYPGIRYETYAVGALDAPDAEAKLVQAVHAEFCTLAGPSMKLYWRLPQKITYDVVQRYIDMGQRVMAFEQYEDAKAHPGLNKTGHALETLVSGSDGMYFGTRCDMVAQIRTRIALVDHEPVSELRKAEGQQMHYLDT